MIIYGSRASHLRSMHLDNESCSHCNQRGSIILSTYTRYAHIFWIPLFSVGRFSITQCQHCKHTMEFKEMPPQIRTYHYTNMAQTRLPLWQFAGLALVAVIIAFGVYGSKVDREKRALLVESPMSGDVYELKTETGAYTTFKIVNVNADTVQIRFNNYEVNKMSGINQIDTEENYSDSSYYLTVYALKEMFETGEVVDVNRH